MFGGERQLQERYPDAYYVSPAIVEMPGQTEVVRTETFAPILYVVGYRDFDEALRLNNGTVVVHLHHRPARGGTVPGRGGQ